MATRIETVEKKISVCDWCAEDLGEWPQYTTSWSGNTAITTNKRAWWKGFYSDGVRYVMHNDCVVKALAIALETKGGIK